MALVVATGVWGSPSALHGQDPGKPLPMCIKEMDGKRVAVPGPCAETPAPVPSQKASSGVGVLSSDPATLLRQVASQSNEQVALQQFEVLVSMGELAVVPLVSAFSAAKEDPQVRWVAGRALGRIGGPRAEMVLRQGLSDPNPTVRIAAVRGLQDMGSRRSISDILPLLDDKAAMVRAAAIDAVGSLGTRQEVPILIDELNSPSNFVNGKGLFVRTHAVQALASLGGQEAFRALIEVCEDADPDTASMARAALLKLSGRATPPPGQGSLKQRWLEWYRTTVGQ